MKKQKRALVCSGGGALGVAHLGVLSELERDEREYDFFAGVSAGAIVCAMKAIGMTTEEIYDFAMNENLFEISLDFTKSTGALFEGEKLLKLLNKKIGNKCIEDLDVTLMIGATDFETGERVILTKGRIVDAVRASCGVPGVFRPFFHKGEKKWLVDGGLTHNFPLDLAINNFKGEIITGIDVNGALKSKVDFDKESLLGSKKDLPETLARMIRIMFKVQQIGIPDDPRVELFVPDLTEFSSMDVRKASLKKIYECGRKSAS